MLNPSRSIGWVAAIALAACGSAASPGVSLAPSATPAASPTLALPTTPAGPATGILFLRSAQGSAETLFLPPNAREPLRMPDPGVPLNDLPLQWSPDGRRLLGMLRGEVVADSVDDLVVIAADGSAAPLRLTHDGQPKSAPAWSPDGRSIAYTRGDPTASQGTALAIVSSDGGDDRVLVPDGFYGFWSPDGRFLAYYRNTVTEHGATQELSTVEVSTGAQRRLSAEANGGAWWSPGSTWLLFYAPDCALCLVRTDGTDRRTLSEFIGSDWRTSPLGWLSDGEVLMVQAGPQSSFLRFAVAGGAPETIYAVDTVVGGAALSPDRRFVAFARPVASDSLSLWVLELATGVATELTSVPSATYDGSPRWQPVPFPLDWPPYVAPTPTPPPTPYPGSLSLAVTGARTASGDGAATCIPRESGGLEITGSVSGGSVTVGLDEIERVTFVSVSIAEFLAVAGKGFEVAAPFVAVDTGSSAAQGGLDFRDLPDADGSSGTISGRIEWTCGPA